MREFTSFDEFQSSTTLMEESFSVNCEGMTIILSLKDRELYKVDFEIEGYPGNFPCERIFKEDDGTWIFAFDGYSGHITTRTLVDAVDQAIVFYRYLYRFKLGD